VAGEKRLGQENFRQDFRIFRIDGFLSKRRGLISSGSSQKNPVNPENPEILSKIFLSLFVNPHPFLCICEILKNGSIFISHPSTIPSTINPVFTTKS
jgi:hypothetical protein